MQLDHIVIVVADLGRAVADYEALGFTVTPGGEHADGRTHNALIPFADGTYLELIAFHPGVDATGHRWARWTQTEGGLADWALRTENLAGRVPELREQGLPLDTPSDGGRMRPDGARLEWRIAGAAPETGLPFLIEDRTPRELRVPGGTAADHANGVRTVSSVVVAVTDLAVAGEHYARLLGVSTPDPTPDPLLAADALHLPCGNATITLATAVAGPIHERLTRSGPGPYAIHLCTDGEQHGWLDSALSHGAPMRLHPAEETSRSGGNPS